jgi:hypothetical protein
MTSTSVCRKALRALLACLIVSLPLGWIVAMLLTPFLWRLEPVLKLELAGHSGPSDWVVVLIWGLITMGMFLAWRRVFLDRKSDR